MSISGLLLPFFTSKRYISLFIQMLPFIDDFCLFIISHFFKLSFTRKMRAKVRICLPSSEKLVRNPAETPPLGEARVMTARSWALGGREMENPLCSRNG